MRPKRTIRIVAFMNEENGLRGGQKYAANMNEKEVHIAAIESDAGAFLPLGFGLNMPEAKKKKSENGHHCFWIMVYIISQEKAMALISVLWKNIMFHSWDYM